METRNKKIFFLLTVLFLMQSCYHYIVNENGYIRPPKSFVFEYQNKTEKLKNNLVIDTTCIYISEGNYIYYDSINVIKKQYLRDNYIRFFSNGRFKQGSLQKLKSFPKDMNNIKTGGIGYYLLKDNAVFMEFYSDINAGSSQLAYAEIDENGNLKIYSGNPRSYYYLKLSKYYNPKQIKKTDIEFYKKVKNSDIEYAVPDW